VEGDKVWIELNVVERPRLGNVKFFGVKKSEEEDINGKLNLAKQTIITENTLRDIDEKVKKYYIEKSYRNVQVRIEPRDDSSFVNSKALFIYVDKGNKVHIDNIRFFGNENVDDFRLKKQMKGTKEMSKATLHPDRVPSRFGETKPFSFNQYMNEWGFLSLSKTKKVLDPYFRFKMSGAKLDSKKYDEDREKILDYYNSLGYRDAQIVDTAIVNSDKSGNINLDIKVEEGRQYYFGNIIWKGNAKYSDSILNLILGINKGDIYNLSILNKRLGKEAAQEGGDISGLYMDEGYLFFRAEPVETAVYNDTIDYEIRITEGPQARIKNVTIAGNERTKDQVRITK
jgi:outer membrane protein insertion porin family